MKFMELVKNCSIVISLLLSIISIVETLRTRYEGKMQREKENAPKIDIYKINFPKSKKINDKDWENSHARYYYGNLKRDISCDGMIRLETLQDKEIYEAKEKKGKIYFTEVDSKGCLMLNFLKDETNMILEHQSTVITFLNQGAFLKTIAVKSADIEYINGGTQHLVGDINSNKTYNIRTNGQFDIILNEITNDFQYSICELNTNVYKSISDGMNILDITFDTYFLKYKSIKINCIVSNSDNDKYELEISLTLNGNFLEPRTKIVKKVH